MPIGSYPVFIVPDLTPVRDFYVNHFGFRAVYDSDWYVHLHFAAADRPPLELAFMRPDVSFQPPALQAPFAGPGVILTFEVEDVTALHAALAAAGVLRDVVVDLRDEAWGQRHFLIRDPAGILLDVVQPIPPAAEFAAGFAATE